MGLGWGVLEDLIRDIRRMGVNLFSQNSSNNK